MHCPFLKGENFQDTLLLLEFEPLSETFGSYCEMSRLLHTLLDRYFITLFEDKARYAEGLNNIKMIAVASLQLLKLKVRIYSKYYHGLLDPSDKRDKLIQTQLNNLKYLLVLIVCVQHLLFVGDSQPIFKGTDQKFIFLLQWENVVKVMPPEFNSGNVGVQTEKLEVAELFAGVKMC